MRTDYAKSMCSKFYVFTKSKFFFLAVKIDLYEINVIFRSTKSDDTASIMKTKV